jgi:hypothetical protein
MLSFCKSKRFSNKIRRDKMRIIKSEKTIKIEGIIEFELKELGKLYKKTADISCLTIENMLAKNSVPDGLYLIVEISEKNNWQRIIHKSKSLRSKIRMYNPNILEVLEKDRL